jgi:hypothetical protein
MNKIWIVVSFSINHNFIATNLCEKRDIPQNHCNGNCWLKKELNKANDTGTNQLPSSKIVIPEVNYLCRGGECKMKNNLPVRSFSYGCYLKQIHLSGFIGDIFHPPRQKSV